MVPLHTHGAGVTLHMGLQRRNRDPQALKVAPFDRVQPVGLGGRPVSLGLWSLCCELALAGTPIGSW